MYVTVCYAIYKLLNSPRVQSQSNSETNKIKMRNTNAACFEEEKTLSSVLISSRSLEL